MTPRQALNTDPDDRGKEAYDFFVKEKGYRPEVALGIVGNLMQESGPSIDTSAIGFDGTGSFGAAQWLGSRKDKLKEIRPKDYDTLRGQLEFIDWELNNTEKRANSKLQQAQTVEDAARVFSKYYERPHKDYAHNDKRVRYATSLGKKINIGSSDRKEEKLSGYKQLPKQTVVDNTRVRTPSLATPPVNGQANYTSLPEAEQKTEEVKPITEKEIRRIFEEYKKQESQNKQEEFYNKFQQSQQQAQPQQYQPQAQPIDQMYQIVDINQFSDGGTMNCGGEGEPPCEGREMKVGETANTWTNMFGNVGQYMFGIEDEDIQDSPYRPTSGANLKDMYYTRPGMREDVYNDLTSDRVKKDYNHNGTFGDIYKALKSNGEDREHNADKAFPKNKAGYKGQYNKGHGSFKGEFNLGRYRTDAGKDKRGRYISFSDTYDWNGLKTDNSIPFYDRIYENEWEDYSSKVLSKKEQNKVKRNNKIKKLSSFPTGSKL